MCIEKLMQEQQPGRPRGSVRSAARSRESGSTAESNATPAPNASTGGFSSAAPFSGTPNGIVISLAHVTASASTAGGPVYREEDERGEAEAEAHHTGREQLLAQRLSELDAHNVQSTSAGAGTECVLTEVMTRVWAGRTVQVWQPFWARVALA
jgi:hypothetical protein